MTAKRLAKLALYTAIALIIHVVEALVPLPFPIPGVKLGLANAVTLFMLFAPGATAPACTATSQESNGAGPCGHNLRISDVLIVLFCRILLGALISGRPIALLYSLAGGLLAVLAQILVKRFVSDKQIWACGAIGAVMHNIGQIMAAVVITGTAGIVIYLPVLIIAGVFTGVFTGVAAQLAVTRLKTVAF